MSTLADFEEQVRSCDEPPPGTGEPVSTLLKPMNFLKASDWLELDTPEPDQIIADFLDVGDKLAIFGTSKTRKSFFVLQLCLCVAAGKDFCGLHIPTPRRVIYVQFEIQQNHLHRRLKKLCAALKLEPSTLQNFHILNARGLGLAGVQGIDRLKTEVKDYKPEMIVLDPLYKVNSGTENDAKDTKIIMSAFDRLSEDTCAAVSYVHHDAKGSPGERQIQDRGAGSNVLGRDYDGAMALAPHENEPGALVVDCLLRNYPPIDCFSIQWTYADDGFCFCRDFGLLPVKRTSRTKDNIPLEEYYKPAKAIIDHEEMEVKLFKSLFKEKTKLSNARINDFLALMQDPANPRFLVNEKRGRGTHKKTIRLSEFEDGI